MRTVLVIIARMGSTRLPGKVLMDLAGRPVVEWVVDAAHNCRLVDDIIVATTTDPKDEPLVDWCGRNSVAYYCGSEEDVLERFYQTTVDLKPWDIAVRVTCDCPFVDPHVIDQVIALRQATNALYASNIYPPTWPDGLDCEAVHIGALTDARLDATSKVDRECVTTWIREHYAFETLICPLPGMHRERWVLDTADDYKLCQKIAEHADRGWLGIKRFLDENPELRKLNAHHPRNERYFAALAEEPLKPRSYEKSKLLLTYAKKLIPLGCQTFSKSEIQYPADSPLFLTHGDGGYCWDVDGNRYIDLVGGLLPVILGHCDPDVDYAVRRQQTRGVSFSLATKLEMELADTLCRLIPCAEWARFGKNGSDVTSAAIRLARAHTGRGVVISAGYHGWHDWAVAWDSLRNKGVWGSQNIATLKHGDAASLWEYKERLVKWAWEDGQPEPAAVIVEPETNPEFLQECRKFCDETGALLIFDEIITGFRFDLGGAQKLYGVTPDIACFGKAMGNGYPISAIVGKKEYYDTMAKISYSGTMFGETLSIAAAIATIEKLEREDVILKILVRQQQLYTAVLDILFKLKHALNITNNYSLPRLVFKDNDAKTLFIQEMAQQGVLVIASHNLMYAHDDSEIQRVITAYKHVLPLLADAIEKDKVKDMIRGRSIPSYANVRS